MEGEEVHGQLFKVVRHRFEEMRLGLERDARVLLEHHLGEAHVADLEAAPQCAHALSAQVERVLAEERRLAGAGRSREHGQLATPVTLEELRERGEPSPRHAGDQATLNDFRKHVLPE